MIKGLVNILNGIQDIFKNLFSYNPDPSWRSFNWDKCTWENQSQTIITSGRKTMVEVNGKVIELDGCPSVSIKNSKVYVNGKEIDKSKYQTENNHITVVFKGDVDNITAEGNNVDITVNNVGNSVKNTNGDIKIMGSVQGNVSTENGDITVKGSIYKSVITVNGDIYGTK